MTDQEWFKTYTGIIGLIFCLVLLVGCDQDQKKTSEEGSQDIASLDAIEGALPESESDNMSSGEEEKIEVTQVLGEKETEEEVEEEFVLPKDQMIGGVKFSALRKVFNNPASVLKTPETAATCEELRGEAGKLDLDGILEPFNKDVVTCDLLSYEHPEIKSNLRVFVSTNAASRYDYFKFIVGNELEPGTLDLATKLIAIDENNKEKVDVIIVSREPALWYFKLTTGRLPDGVTAALVEEAGNGNPADHINSITLYSPEGSRIEFLTPKDPNSQFTSQSLNRVPASELASDTFKITTRPLSDLCFDQESLRETSNHLKNKPNAAMRQLMLAIRRNHGLEKSVEACSDFRRSFAFGNFGLSAKYPAFEKNEKAETRCDVVVTKNRGGFFEQHPLSRNPECHLAVTNPGAFAQTGLTEEDCLILTTPPLCELGINKKDLPTRAHQSVQNCREESEKFFDGCLASGFSEFSKGETIVDQFSYGEKPTANCLITLDECPAFPEMSNKTILDSKMVQYEQGFKKQGEICEARRQVYKSKCTAIVPGSDTENTVVPFLDQGKTAPDYFTKTCRELQFKGCLAGAVVQRLPPSVCDNMTYKPCFNSPEEATPDFEIRHLLENGTAGEVLKEGDVVRIPNFVPIDPEDTENTVPFQDVLKIVDKNREARWFIDATFPQTFYRLSYRQRQTPVALAPKANGVVADFRVDGTLQFFFARDKRIVAQTGLPEDFRVPVTLTTNSIKDGLRKISFVLEVGNPPIEEDFEVNARDEFLSNPDGDIFFAEILRLDVNGDGCVTALDGLQVINYLGRNQAPEGSRGTLPLSEREIRFDVNRDGRISALDSLQVINFLGRSQNRCLD